MLSKNLIKYVQSLDDKKNRQAEGVFLVEGEKSVQELLASDFEVEILVITEEFYQKNYPLIASKSIRIETANATELAKAGTLKTNDAALAVVKTKPNDFLCVEGEQYALVLDDVRDPGNLGTIIRIADWYGIEKIICSNSSTDWYSPKVIAASKGSFTRVRGYYCHLADYLAKQANQPIYGTFMAGQNVHKMVFAPSGYLVMGNESNGISNTVEAFVNQRITIPRWGPAESLNVGIATALVCDNLRRGEAARPDFEV